MTATAYSGHDHLEIWRWKLAERHPTFVYVIRSAHDTAIKVGIAKDVLTRIAELQTGNPRRLNLMYVLPGDRYLEKALHKCLKGSRRLGEWFDGPQIDPFVEAVAELATRMVAGHDQTKRLPDVYDLATDLLPNLARPKVPPAPKPRIPVEVSQVEPTTISMEEKQRRLKARYLRPARPDDHLA